MELTGLPNQIGLSYKDRIISEPVSILMPVYNEAEGIESVIAEIVEVVYRHLPEGSEFLIEEGGSTDGTREILADLQQRWPFLNIVSAPKKEGFAKAARALYLRARCPLVFFLDSDGQCVPSEFWKLVPQLGTHAFVFGAKRTRYDPLRRRLMSRTFNLLARRVFNSRFQDINFGFRLCRREAVLACLEHCREMPTMLNAEMALAAILSEQPIAEVVVHHRPRLYGSSRGFSGPLIGEAFTAFCALLRIRKNSRKIASSSVKC